MCLTKILLPLQCLHSANTLSAQYQITVVALPLFIYTSIGSTCTSSIEKINRDFEYEIVNFGSPNLIILKKKSKNTIKYHNIFIFRIWIDFFFLEKYYIHNIFRINSKWQVVIGFKLITLLLLFSKHLFSVVVGYSLKFYYFISTYKKLIL